MEDVTALVVATLDKKLGGTIPIYTENMDDGGLEEPSFFVSRGQMLVKPQLFSIRHHSYSFHLTYLPSREQPKEDMDRMAEWLASNFKWIEPVEEVDDQAPKYAKVEDIEFSISEDNLLHFSFSIKIRVDDVDRGSPFKHDQLRIQEELKHGQKEK